ncbi:DUF3667 domain-containing protein [Undibacterium sp. Di26W]|uniref:DUF3667 domain-containing protein n=1 Tax=Undibacterium sp. Di26W TaxID=3413035 RepID=UPI003BF31E82
MSMEIEIATDVIAEALVVNEVEKTAGTSHASHAHGSCANCGTSLTGAYCHACGQAAHIHRSLLHMAEELLHGLFHFETKAWRTIPALIFKPGQLTRNYIQGQRTRYVSPLALFLFLIFVMFFVLSLTASNPVDSISDKPQTKTGITKALQKNREAMATLEAAKALLPAGDDGREDMNDGIKDLASDIAELEASLKRLESKENKDQVPASSAISAASEESNTTPDVNKKGDKVNDVLKKIDRKIAEGKSSSIIPGIEKQIQHAIKNPELTVYKMKSNASKFAFMLMPISLPFLWLLFIFKRKYVMFDHAVFSLYSLCFMSILLMSVAILAKFGFGMIGALVFVFVPPLHMFSQLKHAYQLGTGASLWRTVALLFVALCSLCIYAVLVLTMSV